MVHEWGADFRPLYRDIWTLRLQAPDHLMVVTLSATMEPGPQTECILRHLGFHEGTYHLDHRDCEHHNVTFIFQDILFPYTGYNFHDLDWLIPDDLTKATSEPKRLLYCDTIELGHRVTQYLRSLLSPSLNRTVLVRHLHLMNCPDCKVEGLAALKEPFESDTCLRCDSNIGSWD